MTSDAINSLRFWPVLSLLSFCQRPGVNDVNHRRWINDEDRLGEYLLERLKQ